MFSEPCFPFSAPRHALSQSDFGNRARENDGRERKKTTKSEISRRGLVQTDQTTVDTRDFNFFRVFSGKNAFLVKNSENDCKC